MGLAPDYGSVNKGESAFETSGEKAGVLVFGGQKRPETSEGFEIFGNRERNNGSALAERDVSNSVLFLFFEPDNAGVFEAPSFLSRIVVCLEGRRGVNFPVGQAVGAAYNGEMRKTAHILAPDKEKGFIVDFDGAGVKDGVDSVGPVERGQYGITRKAFEKLVSFFLSFEVNHINILLKASMTDIRLRRNAA
jgi:hypothetical protein